MRLHCVDLARVLAGALLLCQFADAQNVPDVRTRLELLRPKDFPERPVEIVVAYPPGGAMDAHARLVAKHMQQISGYAFVTVNKAGAGGFIGNSYVLQAKPDGYVLGAVTSSLWADSLLRVRGKWQYQDAAPLAFINYDRLTWIVANDGRYRNLEELISSARNEPGNVKVAAARETSSGFLAEQVQAAAGVEFNHIPYQGGNNSLLALLGGHIDVGMGYYSEFRGAFVAGKVRPLAVAGSTRSPQLAQVPTFNELLGKSDIVWDSFRFLVTRKDVAADRRRWLEAVANAALDSAELAKEESDLGVQMDRSLDTAEKIAAEIERRVKVEREFYVRTGRLPR